MPLRSSGRVVGVACALVLGAAASDCGSAGLPSGGTFTLSWQTTYSESTKAIPYSGAIAGIPVRGSAVNPATIIEPFVHSGATKFPKSLTIARWSGSLESTPFAVSVTVGNINEASPSQETVVATGTYGSQHIRVTVKPLSASASSIHFAGTIGSHHVQGTISIPNARRKTGTAKGTFTLSS